MYRYKCINNIAKVGLDNFSDDYTQVKEDEAAECILVRSAKMHDMVFDKELLAIARAGAGVNNIPLDRCAEEGIVVFNTPGANANAVKELVIFALIASIRDITGGIQWAKGEAENPDIAAVTEKEKKAFVGNEIFGKSISIIGVGAIGVKVANACVALGLKVKGYDAFLSEAAKNALDKDVVICGSLEEAVKDVDFVSVHVPAMDSTKGMVNEALIAKMKDGAVVINAARDTLVNEPDMAKALESGKIRKYVCDFPTPGNSTMKNTIIIPHLGASTEEAEDNCAVMAVKELSDFMENGNIINSVNFPRVTLATVNKSRITIIHKAETPAEDFMNMIKKDAAIEDMASGTRGKYSYSIFELKESVPEGLIDALKAADGVVRVRGING